jgi:hypothetical protein
MYSKQLILKKGFIRTELEESTWRIKIRSLSLELSHVNTNIFVIFFLKIEIFDLQAVSIFATCTGESDTTTPCLEVIGPPQVEWKICLSEPRCYGDCLSLVKKTNVNSKNKQDPNPSRYILC